MIGIGDHQLGGFDGFAANALFGQSARDERRGQAFAETGDCVERARREFVDERRAFAETLRFAEIFVDPQRESLASFGIMNQCFECRLRAVHAKLAVSADARSRSPASEHVAGFDEPIGDTAHRRDNHDDGILARGLRDDFGDTRNAGSVADGCASKFHDLQE